MERGRCGSRQESKKEKERSSGRTPRRRPRPAPRPRGPFPRPGPSRLAAAAAGGRRADGPSPAARAARLLLPLVPDAPRSAASIPDAPAQTHAKEGDIFFIITSRWWQSWIDYVIQDSAGVPINGSHHHELGSNTPTRPGAIDSTNLLDDLASEVSDMEIELYDTLVEARDYILLPQQVWEKLHVLILHSFL